MSTPFSSTHINIEPIPDALRHLPDSFSESLLEYVQFQQSIEPLNVEDTDTDAPQFAKLCIEAQDRFKKLQPQVVEMKAKKEDIEMMIEFGLRKYTGCGAYQDKAGAHDLWTRAQVLATAGGLSKRRLAALAAIHNAAYFINIHLDNRTQSTLQNAGFCADFAASRGLITPTTIFVAQRLEMILQNLQLLEEWIRNDFKRQAEGYKALWDAWDRRKKAIGKRDEHREAKVRKAPNKYECARDGCPIQATSQRALLRCGGPCPEELKPAYCSAECQKQDWKFHKPQCKPRDSATPSAVIVHTPGRGERTEEDEDDEDEVDRVGSKANKTKKKNAKRRQKKKELRMTVPGSDVMKEITSTTIDLDMLKEIHGHLANMALNGPAAGQADGSSTEVD